MVGCDVAVLHRHVGGGLQTCRCRTTTSSIVTVACNNRTRFTMVHLLGRGTGAVAGRGARLKLQGLLKGLAIATPSPRACRTFGLTRSHLLYSSKLLAKSF